VDIESIKLEQAVLDNDVPRFHAASQNISFLHIFFLRKRVLAEVLTASNTEQFVVTAQHVS